MNAYATFAVNAHLQDLLDEAAANRAASVGKTSMVKRIASAANSVKTTLQSPADYSNSIIPDLQEYPYRS
jgi:hypothetical protein